MKRILIVYNPRSSRFSDVREEVLEPAKKLKGFLVGKYEVAPTNIEDNIKMLAKLIEDGDTVVSAGGDATGIITVNGVMKSKKNAKVGILPYGNFNDLSRTLETATLDEVLKGRTVKYHPLAVYADGKFWRYATCYVTMGMTAEAVKLYDAPEMRKKLKSKYGREVTSYTELIRWYFKNRRTKQFIPACSLNGRATDPRVSDYAAVNGRYMARVMRGREDFLKPREFRSMIKNLTGFWQLFSLMFTSIVDRVPGRDTTGDVLEFFKPSSIEVQAEGESKVFEKVRKIEVRKAETSFRAICK